jgi:hypothetical protein
MESSTYSDTSSTAFLEGLPDETPKYRFINVPDLERKVAVHEQDLLDKKTTNQFVVFLDIPDRAVDRITAESSPISHYRIFFAHSAKVLIIKMTSMIHERAAAVFSNLFEAKVSTMGLSNDLISVLTAQQSYNGVRKCPDNQWGLQPLPQHQFAPSLILECGYSESPLPRLAIDARWWLESSQSPVEMVITIKICHGNAKIIVQKWELGTRRQGSYSNARANSPLAVKTGEVSISRQNNNTVVSGTIVLPFDKIFRRPPNPAQPLEGDIMFTVQDLETIAEQTWRIQGFMW